MRGWRPGADDNPHCYADADLPRWVEAAKTWAAGGQPEGLPYFGDAKPAKAPRDTFVFFIHGGKVRAPAGAMKLIEMVR